MTKDQKAKKSMSARTMETRQSKLPKLDEGPSDLLFDDEVTSNIVLLPRSIAALDRAIKIADPNAKPLKEGIISTKPSESCGQTEEEGDRMNIDDIAEGSVKQKSNELATLSGTQQYEAYPDPNYVLDDPEQCSSLRLSGVISCLAFIPIAKLQSMGPYKLSIPSGIIEISVYDQIILKVCGEYYIGLPPVSHPDMIVRVLHYWLRTVQGPPPNKDVLNESFARIVEDKQIGRIVVIVAYLALTQSVINSSITSSVNNETCKLIIEDTVRRCPVTDGTLRMVQAIAEGRQDTIEPVHQLLINNEALSKYVTILAIGSENFTILEEKVDALVHEDLFNTEVGGKSLLLTGGGAEEQLGGAVHSELGGPSIISIPHSVKSAQPEKGKGKQVIQEPLDQRMLSAGRLAQKPAIRDTSNFQLSAVTLSEAKEIISLINKGFSMVESKLTSLFEKKLEVIDRKITVLGAKLDKHDETMSVLLTRASQENLMAREKLNSTLLKPQSTSLLNIVSSTLPTQPIHRNTLERYIERLNKFLTPGDSMAQLVADGKKLLLEHNCENLAANLNEQSLESSGARARLIYILTRKPTT